MPGRRRKPRRRSEHASTASWPASGAFGTNVFITPLNLPGAISELHLNLLPFVPVCPAGASTLDKDSVERMVAEAERFAADDKARREAVDTKNSAESMVYQTEKQMKEFDEKLTQVRAGAATGAALALLLMLCWMRC